MAARTADNTLRTLAELLHDPELSRKEAINLLVRINRREAEIPDDVRIYRLLEQINVEDMAERPHRGQQKEKDRRHGFQLRKNRTGNRRG